MQTETLVENMPSSVKRRLEPYLEALAVMSTIRDPKARLRSDPRACVA